MTPGKTRKIDETLKKLYAAMPNGTAPGPKNGNGDGAPPLRNEPPRNDLPGDPSCPLCDGIGYLRDPDLPVGHPDFGKLQVCSCRKDEVTRSVRERLFAMSHLNELVHLTFESFSPRGQVGLPPYQADTLERAYNQARQFAQSLNGWLLLQGGYGCGKTHLAAAVANWAVSLGVPTLFITVPDLLDSLRSAYHDPGSTFEQRFEEVRQVQLLVLDDFGTQNATTWAQEKLFQIINYRYINHLPLVVTTNLSLKEIEGRIRSRLEDPQLVTVARIQAPDFRRPATDTSQPELSALQYLHNRTFANFDLRQAEGLETEGVRSLDRAFRTAREWAEHPHGWLVFVGPYGSGKTHLAAAIANYRTELGHPPLFVVVPDLLDHLRAAFNPNSAISLDQRFEEVRSARLLILDDLGTQSATPWAREKLYQLFNHRYNAELPTVITTSRFGEEIDPRLISRMQDSRLCTICAITVPGYRGQAGPTTRPAARKKRPG